MYGMKGRADDFLVGSCDWLQADLVVADQLILSPHLKYDFFCRTIGGCSVMREDVDVMVM